MKQLLLIFFCLSSFNLFTSSLKLTNNSNQDIKFTLHEPESYLYGAHQPSAYQYIYLKPNESKKSIAKLDYIGDIKLLKNKDSYYDYADETTQQKLDNVLNQAKQNTKENQTANIIYKDNNNIKLAIS